MMSFTATPTFYKEIDGMNGSISENLRRLVWIGISAEKQDKKRVDEINSLILKIENREAEIRRLRDKVKEETVVPVRRYPLCKTEGCPLYDADEASGCQNLSVDDVVRCNEFRGKKVFYIVKIPESHFKNYSLVFHHAGIPSDDLESIQNRFERKDPVSPLEIERIEE